MKTKNIILESTQRLLHELISNFRLAVQKLCRKLE